VILWQAICFNHALYGFAASLTRVAASYVGFGPVSSTELLQLLPCDEPSPWVADTSPGTLGAGCWRRAVSSWKADRRFRLLLASRGVIYAANAIVMFATALAFPPTTDSVTIATLTTNIGGGVFPALLFMGARKHFIQQPAWLPDLQMRRLSSVAATVSREGKVGSGPAAATALLSFPDVPFALPEGLGHANMVFVLIVFSLAGLYQIRTTTIRADPHWGTAITGAYVVVCLYHLVFELLGCIPALRAAAASDAAELMALDDYDASHVPDTDEEDLRVQLIAAAPTRRQASRRRKGDTWGRLPYILSFEASCELADLAVWVLYGALPKEKNDWALIVAIVVTTVHFCVLAAAQLRPVIPAFSTFAASPFQLVLSLLDVFVLAAWSITVFVAYPVSSVVAAGIGAAAFALTLATELVLRRVWTSALPQHQLVPRSLQ
jgi:hypothetical protein